MIGGYYHDNPFESILGGYVTGLNIKRTQDQNKYLQAQEAHNMSAMQALEGLDFDDENAVRQFVARYPEYGKGAKEYVAGLDEKRHRALLSDMSQTIALLQNKRSDLAVQRLGAKAQAFRNSGDEKTALEYEEMADWISTDTTSAYNGLVMSYATLTDKDSASNYKAVIEANRPTTEFKNVGDRFVPVTTDPITGEVSTDGYDGIGIGVSPDAQVQQDTAIITTGMNNDTEVTTTGMKTSSAEKVATINGQFGVQKAHVDGHYGIVQEGIKQEGENHRNSQDNATKLFEIKSTNEISWFKAKNEAGKTRHEEERRIQKATVLLDEIENLLESSTGSWVGTGIDKAAGVVGISTKGATAIAQLQTLSGQLVSLMPRMNGPQSDKDVELYKEMAGKLADSTIPVKQRQAALATIRQLNQKYAEINGTPSASQSTKQPLGYYFTGE